VSEEALGNSLESKLDSAVVLDFPLSVQALHLGDKRQLLHEDPDWLIFLLEVAITRIRDPLFASPIFFRVPIDSL
jgi:hypothetical protein